MPTFRQTEIQNPHLRLPLQFGGIDGCAVVNEQDTGEDILDCIRAIVAYQIGARVDLPEFGIPDVLFRQYSDLLVGQIRSAIEDWEDRAIIDIDGGFELTDPMIWDMLVKAGVTSD